MQFGEGVIFVLTREDIINLARDAGYPDIVDDEFLTVIKDGIGDLVAIEIRKYMRELRG